MAGIVEVLCDDLILLLQKLRGSAGSSCGLHSFSLLCHHFSALCTPGAVSGDIPTLTVIPGYWCLSSTLANTYSELTNMSNDQLLKSLLLITCTIMVLLSLASLDCLQQENNTDSPPGEWQASREGDDNGTCAPLCYCCLCKGGWGQCRTLTRGLGNWSVSLEYSSLYLLFSWPLCSVWRTVCLGQGQSCSVFVQCLAL